jgi:hypothetical protein
MFVDQHSNFPALAAWAYPSHSDPPPVFVHRTLWNIDTAKLDRAFRSAADALGTLEQLKDDKVGLHMIDLGGDVTGNGISKLVFTILSAVAENERDRIRERVRDVKRIPAPLQRRQAAFRL